jgi:hypothetical protein
VIRLTRFATAITLLERPIDGARWAVMGSVGGGSGGSAPSGGYRFGGAVRLVHGRGRGEGGRGAVPSGPRPRGAALRPSGAVLTGGGRCCSSGTGGAGPWSGIGSRTVGPVAVGAGSTVGGGLGSTRAVGRGSSPRTRRQTRRAASSTRSPPAIAVSHAVIVP